MTNVEVIAARSRAIRFFGEDAYWEMVQAARDKFNRDGLYLPPQGIEYAPEFWQAIDCIINDSL